MWRKSLLTPKTVLKSSASGLVRLPMAAHRGSIRCASTFSSGKSAEELEQQYIVPTYAKGGMRTKEGLVFESGKGSVVFDSEGNEYIDMGAGIAVTVLGHSDKDWMDAINEQVGKLAHVSNLYHTTPYLELAETLVNNSPGMSKAFFCNSGTEANEAALKFSRVFQNSKNESTRNRFIGFKKSFHGRSLGALSVTYKPAIREPFQPMLMPNVDHVEFNDLEAVEAAIGPDVVAVIMEPVQGEGGIMPATKEFAKGVRELCDKHGVALIFDEVQIGLGRQGNGKLWGYEELGVVPDLLTMAKPLANGLPIGGIMMSEKFYSQVPDSNWLGTHGSTFAANPVVTRAAQVTLEKILAPGFREQVAENGAHLVKSLDAMKERLGSRVTEVRRPLGDAALYAGLQLPGPFVGKVISQAIEEGVIILSAGDDGSVIRLCPPLTISKDQIDKAVSVLEKSLYDNVPETEEAAGAGKQEGNMYKIEMSSTSLASTSEEEYVAKLDSEGHTKLPLGFKVGTAGLEFFPEELPKTPESEPAKMQLTLIVPDSPTTKYAAMFTRNAFPGCPIKVGREIVKSNSPVGAIVVNNKISNVNPRGNGVKDANQVCDAVADSLGLPSDTKVLPSSTGVIGWKLPVDSMIPAVPKAVENLQSDSILPAAYSIMTTDSFPKSRSCVITDAQGQELGRITGIAKGAGMIEPDMATMLVYLVTDIDVDSNTLDSILRDGVNSEGSFNRISVDSDQSTSDSIMFLSSHKRAKLDPEFEKDALTEATSMICKQLAQDVVRNGEGTEHVIKARVIGAPTNKLAHGIGKAIVNSPLVKTAIAGCDANVGRVIGAIGSYVGKANPAWADLVAKKCKIWIGDILVFENSEFCIDDEKEVALTKYLQDSQLPHGKNYPTHYETIDITVSLKGDDERGHESIVYGSDLTHQYVEENAGYRS